MPRLCLEEILGDRISLPYAEQYAYIRRLLDEGSIKPVAAAGKNGKRPALYLEYRTVEPQRDYTDLEHELLYRTSPQIATDYYLRHPEVYLQEREYVRQLDAYLRMNRDRLQVQVSMNERCCDIWGYEKFLSRTMEGAGRTGRAILDHCGLDLPFLNCYKTSEPFAYYVASRRTPQRILILENKDPFYSMRRHLLGGNTQILGNEISTLIYGAGKRVVSSLQEFDLSAEPYMKAAGNELLYWGDLDYEGIGIYENLASAFASASADQGRIVPFVPAYQAMLRKARNAPSLPVTKTGQNRNIGTAFFSYFDRETVAGMRDILEQDVYIPQEILNVTDY